MTFKKPLASHEYCSNTRVYSQINKYIKQCTGKVNRTQSYLFTFKLDELFQSVDYVQETFRVYERYVTCKEQRWRHHRVVSVAFWVFTSTVMNEDEVICELVGIVYLS